MLHYLPWITITFFLMRVASFLLSSTHSLVLKDSNFFFFLIRNFRLQYRLCIRYYSIDTSTYLLVNTNSTYSCAVSWYPIVTIDFC